MPYYERKDKKRTEENWVLPNLKTWKEILGRILTVKGRKSNKMKSEEVYCFSSGSKRTFKENIKIVFSVLIEAF